jgi:predicted kinase
MPVDDGPVRTLVRRRGPPIIRTRGIARRSSRWTPPHTSDYDLERPATGSAAMQSRRAVFLITGISAAGKSTVADLLARRFSRAVHVRGDIFRRMVVTGRAEMTPDPPPEALRQLALRYRQAATVADRYFEAGFTVVVQDVVIGPALASMVELIRSRPLLVIVLCPRPEVVSAREHGRAKTAYDPWSVEQFDASLRRDTPPLGLWIDSSDQTPEETVNEILARAWDEARISERDLIAD